MLCSVFKGTRMGCKALPAICESCCTDRWDPPCVASCVTSLFRFASMDSSAMAANGPKWLPSAAKNSG
eukprot:Skav214935  [mRNA]  locus=scaffold3017:90362:91467:+ [translate_table: standard]